MVTRAGEFPKTVTLQQPVVADAGSLGHSSVTYPNDTAKCAARVWTRSSGEQSFNPAEFPVGSLRLLLRLPSRSLAVGWGVKFEGSLYRIVDIEHRDNDRLVTLEPR